MKLSALSLRHDDDIVTARTRARDLTRRLGFDPADQVRVATAVSELARTGIGEGMRSTIEFAVEGDSAPQLLVIRLTQRREPELKNGGAQAESARAAANLLGARRLMHRFDIARSEAGNVVTMKQVFPRSARCWSDAELHVLTEIENDVRRRPLSLLEELKQQNRELADALQQLEDRQKELSRLNAELFDTNRGVLALYAELDEKAEHLRNADQLKTRFLSNMSHEFRTPLNSILALSRLLQERVDGDLTTEQEKQIGYIRKSALELLELVNDLLDLAKVEAGKIVVRPAEFSIEELFSALRGMLRPLLISQTVALNFDDASSMPLLYSDEGKISQVLRNFLSNALKFTEHGEIRVSTQMCMTEEGERAILSVRDTGIGIAPEYHERIFEEFTQVEGPLQDRVRGTGLGLPLCRKLAHLLGGKVWVESEPGVGSCFYLSVPVRYADAKPEESPTEEVPVEARRRLVALLVEDRPEDRAVIEGCLRDTPFSVINTDRVNRARELLAAKEPDIVLLDIALRGEDTWRFLPEIKRAGIPVVVVSTANERAKGRALGADAWGVKPIHREWLRETLCHVILQHRIKRVLLVDDDLAPRTLLKVMLAPHCEAIIEAADGAQALSLFERGGADLVISDLRMPGMDGLALVDRLRALPAGALLPIVICTSLDPSSAERESLLAMDAILLSKSDLSRDAVFDTILNALALHAVRNLPAVSALDAEAAP